MNQEIPKTLEERIEHQEKLYQFDNELKEELTWQKVCEQVNKPRFHPSQSPSRFTLMKEQVNKKKKGKTI